MQLFGIGFGFGVAGPCLLVCTPAVIAYIAGSKIAGSRAIRYISYFLLGRLSAYTILGALAGLSGSALRRFTGPAAFPYLNLSAGVISILLGVFVMFGGFTGSLLCRVSRMKTSNFTGLFALGFIMGVSPCAPLSALLFEIALMSKGMADGVVYSLAFGLGTSLSTLIVIGGISGLLVWLPERFLRSRSAGMIFRAVCALFLVFLGAGLIFRP